MMYIVKKLFYLIILHLVIASPQINLYLTDWTSNNNDNNSDVVFQHDCLHVAASNESEIDFYHIISYCLTEWSSTWNISQNNHNQKLTFAELYKENITSQQLYLWSAPMDVVERYQIYLDQLSTLNESSSMGKSLFYNCTSPRFGPQCQYSLNNRKSYHLSLNEIIYEFYQNKYNPISLTCYTHLKCNRGSTSICLDWTEICDGNRDCQDGIDEESCWQLQINECKDDEYQCFNGQCISKTFFNDDSENFECLDRSDERFSATTHYLYLELNFLRRQPTFENEDVVCPIRYGRGGMKWSSSCRLERSNIIRKLLFDETPNVTSHECWTAVKCYFEILTFSDPICHSLCFHKTCKEIINETCPDMLNIPAGTLAFGHIFFIYTKVDINLAGRQPPSPRYVCYNDQLCDALHPNESFISFNNATCRRPAEFPLKFDLPMGFRGNWYLKYVSPIYEYLSRCNKISYDDSANCNNKTKYKCINSSKCISKSQLCDWVNNCHGHDDEQCPLINGSCSIYGFEDLFVCEADDKCISSYLLNDGFCHCQRDQDHTCLDENYDIFYSKNLISFPTICDGFTELVPVIIDGRNETDETECEYWSCNNSYTRCNGFWNCLNGADEVDCNSSSSLLNCSSHHHLCVSLNTSQLICLPLEKANDGNIDCVGGIGEPKLCRSNDYIPAEENYYCNTGQNEDCVSFGNLYCLSNCKHRSNGQFCDGVSVNTPDDELCDKDDETIRSDVESFLCAREMDTKKKRIINFSLDKSTNSRQQGHVGKRARQNQEMEPGVLNWVKISGKRARSFLTVKIRKKSPLKNIIK